MLLPLGLAAAVAVRTTAKNVGGCAGVDHVCVWCPVSLDRRASVGPAAVSPSLFFIYLKVGWNLFVLCSPLQNSAYALLVLIVFIFIQYILSMPRC